jgi:hypothetical protein
MLVLVAVTYWQVFSGSDIPSGLLPLIGFLPMAFFFSEYSAYQRISKLEARIVELEEANNIGAGQPATHSVNKPEGVDKP